MAAHRSLTPARVSGRARATSPELDSNAPDDDRAKTEFAHDVVNESCYGEPAFGLVFEPEYSFELRTTLAHDRTL